MKLRNLYLNFWTRNIMLYIVILIVLVLGTLLNPDRQMDYEPQTLKIIKCPARLLIIFILIGTHNKIMYEHFLINKKYIQYVSGFIFIVLTYFLINLYSPFSINPIGGVSSLISTIFIYVLGLGFYIVHKNVLEKNILSGQQLLKKEEEIRYLRSQLNPHFLFNALNNLYGVSLSKPEETSDKILELSELLRYQIESSQKETILIKDEINYLNKYFNYELDRNHKLKINFKEEGDYNNMKLAPLLLMPFIENAIKFSTETDDPIINIHLSVINKWLRFNLINNYSGSSQIISGTNTGISNTKKRLDLIYQNKYELLIKDQNGIYDVRLKLQI